MLELSVIATVYNDEMAVPLLVQEIIQAVSPLSIPFEIILVNDHSRDQSEAAIQRESEKYRFVKGLTLTRTYGQQIAISAGIRLATGKYLLLMDGDLQNPPSEIPRLYEKIREGYDIVYTRSTTRNHWLDELSSQCFWFVAGTLLGLKFTRNQLMMRIMTADFARNFNLYSETNRVVAGITQDIGMRSEVVELANRKRRHGKSHYSLLSRFELFLDTVLALSNRPLNALIYVGGFTSFIFLILAGNYWIKYFIYEVPPGYSSVIISICLFGSVNIAMLGVIGRYLSNIYTEVRNRPLFLVQKKFNL